MGNPDRRLIGIAVSEGVAFGNAYLYRPQPQAVTLSGSAGGDAAQRYVPEPLPSPRSSCPPFLAK